MTYQLHQAEDLALRPVASNRFHTGNSDRSDPGIEPFTQEGTFAWIDRLRMPALVFAAVFLVTVLAIAGYHFGK